MGLSSNTLIHLTDNEANLKSIICDGFRLKYCFENVNYSKGSTTGAYPMVCFSDIPLSQLGRHLTSYGSYGIGLKKQWAKNKGLNPVIYIDDESTLGAIFGNSFGELWEETKDHPSTIKFKENIIYLLSYTKNYEGALITRKVTEANYRFSDEREWRYVPDQKALGDAPTWIHKSKYKTKEQKDTANEILKSTFLQFTPDDINYIFVENESQISKFIEIIRSANRKSTIDSVERLYSRIITRDQINTDI